MLTEQEEWKVIPGERDRMCNGLETSMNMTCLGAGSSWKAAVVDTAVVF